MSLAVGSSPAQFTEKLMVNFNYVKKLDLMLLNCIVVMVIYCHNFYPLSQTEGEIHSVALLVQKGIY